MEPKVTMRYSSWSSAGNRGRLALVSLAIAATVCCFAAAPLRAAELKEPTIQAFDRYVRTAESGMNSAFRTGNCLWVDALPAAERTDAYSRLRGGEILVQPRAAGLQVQDGMIHDWVAVAFIPGATIETVLATLQNYNSAQNVYAPELVRSKILSHDNDHFRVFLRFHQHSLTSVVLDVLEEVQYTRLDALHAHSRSQSIRITDVINPGTPGEYEDAPGQGRGYLWRMNNYGCYRQEAGGSYIQFETIALSRGIPYGLGWLLKPLVRTLPRDSLTFTLSRARKAVQASLRK
jgi:hypothetical protein